MHMKASHRVWERGGGICTLSFVVNGNEGCVAGRAVVRHGKMSRGSTPLVNIPSSSNRAARRTTRFTEAVIGLQLLTKWSA